MTELLHWIEEDPVRFVALAAVAILGGRLLWRRLTRRYRPIPVTEAVCWVNDGETLFLDVRTTPETRGGVLPGAVHIPKHQLRRRLQELRSHSAAGGPVVVYCHSGMRSAGAAHLLTRHGFEPVYNLQGGVMAWHAQGLPFESGPGARDE
ncbi:rhodanese-like domain-containing protein [Halorhodospira halophila]|uniref:Rhodanese domain protein n=1 Tax=Halorhodospira halophila (strain DSM 244 / SL1) TaxID=349124 RepID=A1WUW2_HALHL|nr:rhodanese-like domain-containing protein [Halorhodospira halophila]ABM61474.1 Rhodanese domain protein [Halorhodospira halophila SL1]MBK1728721.1 rhodanese-like domain-containing protein [Halorhodospira halophila]